MLKGANNTLNCQGLWVGSRIKLFNSCLSIRRSLNNTSTNGEVVRYNTETWVSEILNLPSSGSITTLSAFSSSYGAGMQNGKFNIINLDMTHRATLQSQGLGVESVETSEGAGYFITTTSSTSEESVSCARTLKESGIIKINDNRYFFTVNPLGHD